MGTKCRRLGSPISTSSSPAPPLPPFLLLNGQGSPSFSGSHSGLWRLPATFRSQTTCLATVPPFLVWRKEVATPHRVTVGLKRYGGPRATGSSHSIVPTAHLKATLHICSVKKAILCWGQRMGHCVPIKLYPQKPTVGWV